MIGLFGGHREGDETFLECVAREVHEETSYLAPLNRFELLGRYANAEIVGEYYVIRDVPPEAVSVTEGSLLIAERENLFALAQEFAPSVPAAFHMLFTKRRA
jgi:8-oxo-dGTP pyrophosphatase MutT (NUDIX family)